LTPGALAAIIRVEINTTVEYGATSRPYRRMEGVIKWREDENKNKNKNEKGP